MELEDIKGIKMMEFYIPIQSRNIFNNCRQIEVSNLVQGNSYCFG